MIKEIFARSKALSDMLIQDRRYLHENAEVGFKLEKTVSYIEKRLNELGLLPKRIGKCGVFAIIGDTSKPAILLRADTDALPIQEQTELEYKSQNGNMHSCGHDMHTAMLLGAAQILKQHAEKLKCCVKLLFQPAEELLSGAKDCIQNGIMKNPEVKCAFMLHVLTDTPLPCGSVIVSSGGITAPAASFFKIEAQGKSAHGAAPQAGTDAIRICTDIIQQLYSIESAIESRVLLSIGTINGGRAPNVVCDYCVLEGSLRAFSEKSIVELKRLIDNTVKNTAKAHCGNATVKYTAECPPLRNDLQLSEKIYMCLRNTIENVYLSDELLKGEKRLGGSEDFSCFSRLVPSLMIGLCAGSSAEGYDTSLHNPKTLFDENALPIGAGIYASLPFLI